MNDLTERLISLGARETCPVCDCDRWRVDLVATPSALRSATERGKEGRIERVCQICGFVQTFTAALLPASTG